MPSLYSLRSFLVFASLLLSQSVSAEQKCYALNGTQLDSTYAPCNPSAKHSSCCATNRTTGTPDLCLSNGLCMATNNEYMGTIWQSGCTDPTGSDPSCRKTCPDARKDAPNSAAVPAWNIQTCDFGTYCCRSANDTTNCCADATTPKIRTKLLATFQFETSTSSTSTPSTTSTLPSSTSTPRSTSPPPTTPTPSQAPALSPPSATTTPLCTPPRNHTAIISSILSGTFTLALLSLLFVIQHLHRKEKRQRKLKEHYEAQFATSSWGAYKAGSGSVGRCSGEEKEGVEFIGKERGD